MKVLIAASEVVPFAKTGGLADVTGALPPHLKNLGIEVRVIMPGYKTIKPQFLNDKISPLSFSISWPGKEEKVMLKYGILANNVPLYFVCQERYFGRENLYGDARGDYPDNGERFAFFCQAALEALKRISFRPDVIHCHDWQTGLIPVYLKNNYQNDPFLKEIKTLYTVHNLAYQGLFDKDLMKTIGLREELFHYQAMEFYGRVNFLKAGLVYADLINTVSEKYAQEIQSKEFGEGLEGVLQERAPYLYGITNGIDYEEWNPLNDKELPYPYDIDNLENKKKNKAFLQKEMGLEEKDVPLIGFIGRLADQKGLDLISAALPLLMEESLQFVFLGKGDATYEEMCRQWQEKYRQKVAAKLEFNASLSRRIYAASDIFFMPSRFEPCGLGQLIAMRYGTIPLAHSTGGLAQTVIDYDRKNKKGNGFIFSEYSARALINCLKKALSLYADRKAWNELVKKAMRERFSWNNAAEKYLHLYKKVREQ